MLRLLFRQIEELVEGIAAGLQDELLGRLGGQILHVLTGLTHDLLTAALGHGLRVGDDLLGLSAGGVELLLRGGGSILLRLLLLLADLVVGGAEPAS